MVGFSVAVDDPTANTPRPLYNSFEYGENDMGKGDRSRKMRKRISQAKMKDRRKRQEQAALRKAGRGGGRTKS